jgi:hypothetical protein
MAHRATSLDLVAFGCEDYLSSKWGRDGLYDESAEVQIIYNSADAIAHDDIGFLEIGRPGVDGLSFGYRKGERGLWVHYPYENRFERLAYSVAEFVGRWNRNEIVV